MLHNGNELANISHSVDSSSICIVKMVTIVVSSICKLISLQFFLEPCEIVTKHVLSPSPHSAYMSLVGIMNSSEVCDECSDNELSSFTLSQWMCPNKGTYPNKRTVCWKYLYLAFFPIFILTKLFTNKTLYHFVFTEQG
jgi:hypothetical protein